jgi:hypothetical protein
MAMGALNIEHESLNNQITAMMHGWMRNPVSEKAQDRLIHDGNHA